VSHSYFVHLLKPQLAYAPTNKYASEASKPLSNHENGDWGCNWRVIETSTLLGVTNGNRIYYAYMVHDTSFSKPGYSILKKMGGV